MPRLQKVQLGPECLLPPAHRHPAPVHWYGWDSRSEAWYGPNEAVREQPDRRLLQALRAAPGASWYGPVTCCTSDVPASRFFTLVHDLADCAVASIYCHESKVGPAEIVTVIPAARRTSLRPEFAFELVAYARFLGTLSAGAELAVHEGIVSALASESDAHSIVVSFSSGLWPADLEAVLSCCVEKVAVTLNHWIGEAPFPGSASAA